MKYPYANPLLQKPLAVLLLILITSCQFETKDSKKATSEVEETATSLLRHVVMFKFKADTTAEQIAEVENAFSSLPDKIAVIESYEWGLNNSPEGLNKGFTHCFLLTFKSEKDRAIYLPHPDHKEFVALASPFFEDVMVMDYWTP